MKRIILSKKIFFHSSNYFFFLIFFLIVGCNKDLIENSHDFNTNLKKWENHQISSYTMTLSITCYCIDFNPIKIQVDNDVIKKIDGVQIDSQHLSNDYWFAKTIDKLFVFIKDKVSQEPFEKLLEFNQVYGYPEKLYFDMDEMIADEEIGYIVSSFKIN